MNPPELIKIAQDFGLADDQHFGLRLEFGIACIRRVEHLLTEERMLNALTCGKNYLSGKCSEADLGRATSVAAEVSQSHPGSTSLDGAGNAAVSTSYGVAAALAGRALEAAEYASYASVYAYSSSAVTDLSAYREEHEWQVKTLSGLIQAKIQ